jgi:hypothetical protein
VKDAPAVVRADHPPPPLRQTAGSSKGKAASAPSWRRRGEAFRPRSGPARGTSHVVRADNRGRAAGSCACPSRRRGDATDGRAGWVVMSGPCVPMDAAAGRTTAMVQRAGAPARRTDAMVQAKGHRRATRQRSEWADGPGDAVDGRVGPTDNRDGPSGWHGNTSAWSGETFGKGSGTRRACPAGAVARPPNPAAATSRSRPAA